LDEGSKAAVMRFAVFIFEHKKSFLRAFSLFVKEKTK